MYTILVIDNIISHAKNPACDTVGNPIGVPKSGVIRRENIMCYVS